ncbi:hypothetical protein FRC11_007942, partial [Ceratobasidium sp. 423]
SSQTHVDQLTIPKTQDISAGTFDVASPHPPIEFKSLPAAEASSSTHSNQFSTKTAGVRECAWEHHMVLRRLPSAPRLQIKLSQWISMPFLES